MKIWLAYYLVMSLVIEGCDWGTTTINSYKSISNSIEDICHHDYECPIGMICRKEWNSRNGVCVKYEQCYSNDDCNKDLGYSACCLVDYYGNYCVGINSTGCLDGPGILGDSCSIMGSGGCNTGLVCLGGGQCLPGAFCTHGCKIDMDCQRGKNPMVCFGGRYCVEIN